MAGVAPRTILVCAFPAVLSLLTFLWIRKKKNKCNGADRKYTDDALEASQKLSGPRTCSEMVTEKSTGAEMHVKERRESTSDSSRILDVAEMVAGLGERGELQLLPESEKTATCSSSDKITDSTCSDVTNHLERITLDQSENQEKVDSSVSESLLLKENQRNCLQENIVQDSSVSFIHVLPEDATEDTPEVTVACDTLELSLTKKEAPDIVIQPSLEESQTNGNFELSELKLFDNENGEEPELQTRDTVGSFDSVNYSEMDDLTDSPPHSTYSDVQSEGSSDSGKGGSDIQAGSDLSQTTTGEDAMLIYEFELPQELCGRLIGRQGKYVNFIKNRSGANVFIKRHLFNPRVKICAVEGNQPEIKNALELIRKRFPLNQFPNVNLTQVNLPVPCGVMVPETLQLHLPEGVTSDVILSSMVSAGHFFVQQPTHPTYPSLNRLDQCMMVCYSQMETPELPQPVEVGVICSAPTMGGWYRASVVHVYENSEECDVKFVDYGGYSCTSVSSLRQIRSDFMTLPFQASECYLANVKPTNDTTGWSLEACATFEELAQGQILQSLIVAHADDGVPYVHLYRIQGVSTIFINRELVNRGVAQWVEHQL